MIPYTPKIDETVYLRLTNTESVDEETRLRNNTLVTVVGYYDELIIVRSVHKPWSKHPYGLWLAALNDFQFEPLPSTPV